MRKSEFLRNLATATTRQIALIGPTSLPATGGQELDRMARGHATDLCIFEEDPVHLNDLSNPVVRAIRWFSTREVTVSSAVEDMEMAEDAWEYFERKTWQFVNLYSDGNGGLTTDDGKDSGRPRRFIVKARLAPLR